MLQIKSLWFKEHGRSLIIASAVVVVIVAAFGVAVFFGGSNKPLRQAVVIRPVTSPLPPLPDSTGRPSAKSLAPGLGPASPLIDIGPVRVFDPTTPPKRGAPRGGLTAAEAERLIQRGFAELAAASRRGRDVVDADVDYLPGGVVERRARAERRARGRMLRGAELRRLQRSHRAAIKLCYEQAQLETPEVPSKVRVHISLGADGEISRVDVDRPRDDTLGACLARLIRSWSFPADLRPQPVDFSVVYLPTGD